LFGISRQAIYQGQIRSERRAKELALVKPMINEIRRKMPRLGTRKLYYLLQEDFKRSSIKVGRDGLFKYLRSENMLVRPAKSYTKTTYSKHWLKKYPNLMKEVVATRPEEYFVSDITYIKSNQRTHYLSLVTDAFSRKIMGYQLSDDMSSESVVKALEMAVSKRKTMLPLIHHSDRGLQYCSATYQSGLKVNGIKPSMTDGYDCYQNAMAERINGILKQEFLINKCNSGKELELVIKESINTYNNDRPHLSLKMKTPNFIHEKTCEENSTGLLNNYT
jgi:transposase InsO family protein